LVSHTVLFGCSIGVDIIPKNFWSSTYQALGHLSLGEAQMWTGHLEEAHALAERALALARERQERRHQPAERANIQRVHPPDQEVEESGNERNVQHSEMIELACEGQREGK